MNVKSMLGGFLIAVVASTGTYFMLPPPSGAEAASCATKAEVGHAISIFGRGVFASHQLVQNEIINQMDQQMNFGSLPSNKT